MSTLMHNFCGKMLNVTKHQAPFRLTAGLTSPEDVLAASSRHASRHTRTERLQLYCTQLWQEWQSRRQGRLGDKEGNESRFEGEGSETRGFFFFLPLCLLFSPYTNAIAKEAKEEKQYQPLIHDLIP